MSKKEKVLQLFNPDVKGETRWVTVEEMKEVELNGIQMVIKDMENFLKLKNIFGKNIPKKEKY